MNYGALCKTKVQKNSLRGIYDDDCTQMQAQKLTKESLDKFGSACGIFVFKIAQRKQKICTNRLIPNRLYAEANVFADDHRRSVVYVHITWSNESSL